MYHIFVQLFIDGDLSRFHILAVVNNSAVNTGLVQPLWKKIWKFFKKVKTELPCDLAISLLGIYKKKLKKKLIQKDMYITE